MYLVNYVYIYIYYFYIYVCVHLITYKYIYRCIPMDPVVSFERKCFLHGSIWLASLALDIWIYVAGLRGRGSTSIPDVVLACPWLKEGTDGIWSEDIPPHTTLFNWKEEHMY